jgi:predicted DNA-binding transcriptional regulator AlpA
MDLPDLIEAIGALDRADLAALLAAIAARMAQPVAKPGDGPDNLVDIEEASRLLGVSRSWLYHRKVPFTVKIGGRRMYSRDGIQRYIRLHKGRD